MANDKDKSKSDNINVQDLVDEKQAEEKSTEMEEQSVETKGANDIVADKTKDEARDDSKKVKKKKGIIIGGIVGGIALLVGIILLIGIIVGVVCFFKGNKKDTETIQAGQSGEIYAEGEETPLYYIEDVPTIDIYAENYTPGTRTEGMTWDSSLFYWLEDVSATDHTDGNIMNCVISKTYMRDSSTGNIIQYEVYADASSGQIYKIVSIEQLETTLRITDYYYDNGKPNFIFLREDSVYTPTYATIEKVGSRYYFNNDVMVRWRKIMTPNVITEYVLTVTDATYAQFEYSTLPADQQSAYDITEIQMLNAAYNTYNAILNAKGVGMVEGRLVDTTGAPLNNMSVKIYRESDNVLLYQTMTDVEGLFNIYVYLDNEKCYLVVEETDIFRSHIIYNVYLRSSSYGYSCNDLVMHKIDGDEYPVYLDFYSALEVGNGEDGSVTGELLQGATVSIREGSNAYEGNVIKVLEADATGRLCANLPSGIYTAQVQMTGYADSYIEVIVNESETVVNGFLLPLPNQGETGVVMTWSGADVDLDLTLFTPYQSTGGDMAHIGGSVTNDAYGNRLVSDNNAYCEVMYVNTADVGNYKLFVNNYTDSMAGNYDSAVLAEINIYIYIYDSNGFVTVYTFPLNQNGVVWEVVEINGTNLTPVHRVYNQLDGKIWWVASKDAGRLVKEVTYGYHGGEWITENTKEYVYDNSGRIIQENVSPHAGSGGIVIYTYDSAGRIERKIDREYNEDGYYENIYQYNYDEQGKLIYIDEYIDNGTKFCFRTTYSYDDMGRVSECIEYYPNSDGSLEQIANENYYYDENGNMYMSEGFEHPLTYYIYDSAGNCIRSIKYSWDFGYGINYISQYKEYIYEDVSGSIISKDDWKEAYCDLIATLDVGHSYSAQMESFESYINWKYDFIYLDDDNIPELVVSESRNWISVYSYKDGEVHTILDCGLASLANECYEYYPRTGIVYFTGYTDAMATFWEKYYRLNEKYMLENEYYVTFCSYNDLNGNGQRDMNEPMIENNIEEIWYEGRQISQGEYEALPYSKYSFEDLSGKKTTQEAIEALQGM